MFDYHREYEEIPVKIREDIAMMQNFVQDYFEKRPERTPRNIHRIGINIDRNEEKLRIVRGYNNYRELSSIYVYLERCFLGSLSDDSTMLEFILNLNEKGTGFSHHCDESQHMAELAVIAWLGTNVGMEFLEKSLDKSGYRIVKK